VLPVVDVPVSAAAADTGTSTTGSTEGDGQRKIRAVGPQFYPVR